MFTAHLSGTVRQRGLKCRGYTIPVTCEDHLRLQR